LWCIEPGQKIYLEKEFYYKYAYINLDEPTILQKWLKEERSLILNYNYVLMNRKADYYFNLNILKYDLDVVNAKIQSRIELTNGLRTRIDELRKKIERQKRNLIMFTDAEEGHNMFGFNYEDWHKKLYKPSLFSKYPRNEEESPENSKEIMCRGNIGEDQLFRRFDRKKISSSQISFNFNDFVSKYKISERDDET
jgi:hypothetical protein